MHGVRGGAGVQVTPLCSCHGAEMYRTGAKFQCAVTHRARALARYRRLTEAEREARREQQLDHWHAPEGGYMQRRRRELAAQRAEIQERLAQLEQEAVTLVA